MLQSEGMEIKKPRCDILSEKEFIASSAETDAYRKVQAAECRGSEHKWKEI